MHNVWIIARREYLERVRTKAFVILTLLMPALMFAFTVLPARLMMKSGQPRKLLVVTSSPQLGAFLTQQIHREDESSGVNLTVSTSTSRETSQAAAEEKLQSRQIDALLWAADEAIAARGAIYTSRDSSDFVTRDAVRNAFQQAIDRQRIVQSGVPASEVEKLFAPAKFEARTLDKAGIKNVGEIITAAIFLMVLLYVSVLTYGMFVMRSVIEEKNSRIMEVLLASATSQQLMAGKILGVGAVGLTQIAIWALLASGMAAPGLLAAGGMGKFAVTPLQFGFFAIFFVLGYFLYASMCAALGAMCNSDQEAQQLTLFVVLPLVLCMVFMLTVIRSPNAPLSVALSLFPFCSPLLMFLRIMVEQPPVWQIALSIFLLLGTIHVLLWICSRIYRVGILMYGKRPTLPEIIKWVRYA